MPARSTSASNSHHSACRAAQPLAPRAQPRSKLFSLNRYKGAAAAIRLKVAALCPVVPRSSRFTCTPDTNRHQNHSLLIAGSACLRPRVTWRICLTSLLQGTGLAGTGGAAFRARARALHGQRGQRDRQVLAPAPERAPGPAARHPSASAWHPGVAFSWLARLSMTASQMASRAAPQPQHSTLSHHGFANSVPRTFGCLGVAGCRTGRAIGAARARPGRTADHEPGSQHRPNRPCYGRSPRSTELHC
jgi:hypothetical protein